MQPRLMSSKGVHQMQFAVITRAIDSPSVPPQVALPMVKQTLRMLASEQDPRIKAVYALAGQRASILIVEAKSGDELQELVASLPFAPIVKIEVHAIGSIQASLKTVEDAERRVSEMAPVGAR
jgi:muconolactone delta-isomerase